MEDRQLKIIGNQISQGHFEDYIELIWKNNVKISQKQAIYFFVCCCATCNVNINAPENLKEQNVLNLVKYVSKAIVKVTSEEYDTYLQSMYFICKFLLRKNFKLVLQLEAEMVPIFVNETLTEKQKGIYRSLCELIRGEIMNIVSRKEEIDKDGMVSVGYLLSKILIKSGNQYVFFEVIHNYGTCLMVMNVDLELQYNYFKFNCDLAKDGITAEVLCATVLHFVKYGMHIFASNLRNGKFTDAEKTITKLFSVIPILKEWKNFVEVLEICKHLINASIKVEKLKKYKDSFLTSAHVYKENETFLNLCKTISLAINSFSLFCRNHDSEKKFCNPEVHVCVYEILDGLIEFFINFPKTGEKKALGNIREINDLAVSIIILFNTLLFNRDITIEFTTKVLNYLEKCCKYLVSLKGQCGSRNITWSETSAYLYNLGVIYFRKEDNAGTLSVSHMILKYHLLLGKLEDKLVLPNTMGLLSSIYLKEKQYMQALIWTCMQIIYTDETSKINCFNKLLKIKAAAKENDAPTEIQEFNLCSVIQHIPSEYKYYTGFLQNKQTQIDCLIHELEVYHLKWRSKIPMMSAFRQLCDIADNFTLMKVFIKVFSDWETHVHETVVILLEKIFVEYELSVKNTKTKRDRIFLPFLYFFRYKIQNVEIISKNVKEMNKTASILKPREYHVDIMPADAYDQCDVVSTYEGLRISGNKMKNLEHSLKELEGIVTDDITKSEFEDIDIVKIYTLAINLALEFHLHSDVYHSLKAFYLAFSIAVCSDNKILILECGGHLLRHSKNNKLERKLEEEVRYLKTNEQNFKYLIQYYINLSNLYLSENDVQVAIKHYKSAVEYSNTWNELNKKYFWSIDITLELLRFKLTQASKMLKLATSIGSSLGSLMKAHDLMVQKYSTEVEWGPNSMLLFFEVMESIVKMYHDLKMPREVRCFGKKTLTVAQQHQIPIYSVRFLTYLAHADFRSERLYDSRVKLDGISEILLLGKEKTVSNTHISETNSSKVLQVSSITEGFQEMMLDVINKESFNIRTSPSSPVYTGDPYKHPKFSDHKNCECFKCTCIDYQQLTVSRFHLEALWYMYKKQITLAKSFFRGTSEFYEILTKKKRVFPNNLPITSYFSIDTHTNSAKKTCLDEYNYQCSIDYIKFLYLSGAQESARKHSRYLASQLKLEKHIYPNLYGELLLLTLGVIFQNTVRDKISRIGSSVRCKDDPEFRTPEKCTYKITIAKEHSPKIKRILPPKVIKFSLDDLETDGKDDNKTPSKVIEMNYKTPSSKTPRIKILPPSLRSTKTPVFKTPSRKVFPNKHNEFLKTSLTTEDNMKRRPLFEIPEPSPGCGNNSITKIKNEKEVIIKDSCFDVKTKLLTTKIKKTSNETSISSDSCSEMQVPVRRSTRRKRL